ncbi:MAG: hypothetical protein CM1200mP29_05540 [Verrucomicrobiota bacterium]|nr:MAG: hypothetical protein CM1200mP29_05540 [Verrucomicrobiota bacterium]
MQHLYTNAVQPYGGLRICLWVFPHALSAGRGTARRADPQGQPGWVAFYRWLEPVVPESAPKDRGGNRSNYMTWGLVEIPGRPLHLSV